jgi:hypothetical protein
MAIREGARRMGVVANLTLLLSLVLVVFWWRLSAGLFVTAWAVYGAAHVIDGFAMEPAHGQENLSSREDGN